MKLLSRALALLPVLALASPEDSLSQAKDLFARREWKKAADTLLNIPIANWPEPQRIEALRLKAQASSFAKLGEQAESSILEALKLQPNTPDWWILLGDNYQQNFADRQKDALDAYQKALALSGSSRGWQRFASALAIAQHHTDEAHGEAALETLRPLESLPDVAPVWRIKIVRGIAHALASLGKNTEALAKFREALALEKP
jgi:tetratricopeptide (TPR) repeat protein